MKTLPYLAILGRQPEFGLLELESLLGANGVEPYGRYGARIAKPLDVARLGGAVKVAEILYDGPATEIREMPVDVSALPVAAEGKTPFAISVYGLRATPRFVESAGIELKKRLRARGSVRFVAPKDGLAVSAAQLKHNQILDKGFELLVVGSGQRMLVARTTSVQDVDWYSKRDYDRPARSAKVGMLPPKLAQILVNTTSESVVVDPFCGTGVVLQEALLMGRSAVGSDLSPEMVAASKNNLTWLADVAPTPLLGWQVEECDARQVRLPDTACAIVSEGYLGPNMTHSPSPARLEEVRNELRDLYKSALGNWAKQMETGDEVALCVPAWRMGRGWQYLDPVDDFGRLGYTIKVFKHVRTPLLYARPDSVVGRQIVLLRKQ